MVNICGGPSQQMRIIYMAHVCWGHTNAFIGCIYAKASPPPMTRSMREYIYMYRRHKNGKNAGRLVDGGGAGRAQWCKLHTLHRWQKFSNGADRGRGSFVRSRHTVHLPMACATCTASTLYYTTLVCILSDSLCSTNTRIRLLY